MVTLINLLHIAVCIGLIVIVLFQADKSEGLAGAFGGGASNTVFGERGSGGFISNLTTTLAVIFMITSVYLSVFAPRQSRVRPTINTVPAPMSMPMQTAPAAQPVSTPVETTTAAPAASTMAPTAVAPIAPNEAVPAPAPAQVPVTAPTTEVPATTVTPTAQ